MSIMPVVDVGCRFDVGCFIAEFGRVIDIGELVE